MDGIKVRVSKASSAKSASAVNQRRLQSSTTLNRKFVKKPTPVPRIKASAGAASRTLKKQTSKRVLISKGHAVKLQPTAVKQTQQAEVAQATEKVVQKTEVKKQMSEQERMQQQIASKTASNAVSLRDLGSIKVADDEPIAPPQETKLTRSVKARTAARRKAVAPAKPQVSARELKDRAIQQALRKVSMMSQEEQQNQPFDATQKQHFWQKKRFALFASMAVIALVVVGYLVSVNLPDISVRVAAMHTGIEKAYPSYIPASYRLDGLVKEEDGRITMAFKNKDGHKFTLMEEKTSWDSSAVLANYVMKNWGASYSVAKGQGLTIYVSGSNAAWVNGGVFYVITDDDNVLSSSDLHDIAVSL